MYGGKLLSWRAIRLKGELKNPAKADKRSNDWRKRSSWPAGTIFLVGVQEDTYFDPELVRGLSDEHKAKLLELNSKPRKKNTIILVEMPNLPRPSRPVLYDVSAPQEPTQYDEGLEPVKIAKAILLADYEELPKTVSLWAACHGVYQTELEEILTCCIESGRLGFDDLEALLEKVHGDEDDEENC